MIATEVAHLRELVNLVHDYWFNVEKVILDRATGVVSFPVEPKRSDLLSGSSNGFILEVRNVRELTIMDTEKVGYYDIDQLTFDSNSSAIILTGGIPIEIIFRISVVEILLTKLAS